MKTAFARITADRTALFLGLIAFAFPTLLVALHSHATSPLDEWVFIDYVSKVFEQGFVHVGERVGEFTNTLMACDGVMPGGKFGDCSAGLPANYAALPYSGLTAAAAYTPAYFFATRLLGLPFQLVGIDPLTAWRMTGPIWLTAGVLMSIALLRRWNVANRVIWPLMLALIASPFVWWAQSFVSTDAPSIFIGALLLYLATRIRRGEIAPWWFVIAAIIASAFKVTNLVGIGLGVIYLVGSWVADRFIAARSAQTAQLSRPQMMLLVWPIVAGAAATVLQVGWAKFIIATAVSSENVDQGIASPLSKSELATQVFNFLPSVLSYSPFSGHGKDFIFTPLSWLLIAGVIGAFFVVKKWNQRTEIVSAILLASLTMAPALAIAVQVAQGSYFQLSPRYGASLIAAFILCTAFILKNRIAQIGLSVYAGGLMLVGIAAALMLN